MTGTRKASAAPVRDGAIPGTDSGRRDGQAVQGSPVPVTQRLMRGLRATTAKWWPRTAHSTVGGVTPATEAIFIRAGALACAVSSARLGHPNEVGGILVGYRKDSALVVTDTISVPNEPTPYGYRRDHATAETALAGYLAVVPEFSPAGYVGEWHSHPTRRSASLQDLTELSEIAEIGQEVVGLLVLGLDEMDAEPYGYLCDGQGLPRPVAVETIDVLAEDGLAALRQEPDVDGG